MNGADIHAHFTADLFKYSRGKMLAENIVMNFEKTVDFDQGPGIHFTLQFDRANNKPLLTSPETKPEIDTFESRQREFEAFIAGKSKSIWS